MITINYATAHSIIPPTVKEGFLKQIKAGSAVVTNGQRQPIFFQTEFFDPSSRQHVWRMAMETDINQVARGPELAHRWSDVREVFSLSYTVDSTHTRISIGDLVSVGMPMMVSVQHKPTGMWLAKDIAQRTTVAQFLFNVFGQDFFFACAVPDEQVANDGPGMLGSYLTQRARDMAMGFFGEDLGELVALIFGNAYARCVSGEWQPGQDVLNGRTENAIWLDPSSQARHCATSEFRNMRAAPVVGPVQKSRLEIALEEVRPARKIRAPQ